MRAPPATASSTQASTRSDLAAGGSAGRPRSRPAVGSPTRSSRARSANRSTTSGSTIERCDEDPLHRHAHLAGVVEAALDQGRHDLVEIGVGGHDHRRHAAMLEGAARARRQLASAATSRPAPLPMKLKKPTRGSVASRSASSRLVDQQRSGTTRSGRPASCRSATKRKQDSGVVGGRLDDHRAAGRDGRPDLVHDEVERVVEGAEIATTTPIGSLVVKAQRSGSPRRRQAHRDLVACRRCAASSAQFRTPSMARSTSTRESTSGLPPSRADLPGKVLAPCLHRGRGLAQNLDALVRLRASPCDRGTGRVAVSSSPRAASAPSTGDCSDQAARSYARTISIMQVSGSLAQPPARGFCSSSTSTRMFSE